MVDASISSKIAKNKLKYPSEIPNFDGKNSTKSSEFDGLAQVKRELMRDF